MNVRMWIVMIVALALVVPAGATVLSDFESGSSDYDNNGSQTTGKFRDTQDGADINISDNGAGNDYLQFGDDATTVYDTSPSDPANADLFLVPAGETATLKMDFTVEVPTGRVKPRMGLFDPDASGTPLGLALVFNPRGGNNSNEEGLQLQEITDDSGTFGSTVAATVNDRITGSATVTYQFELVFENNGSNSGATVTGRMFELDELEGTVGSQVEFIDGETTDDQVQAVIAYGTDTGEFDLDPASNGLGILLHFDHNGGSLRVDNLDLSVTPEPATLAILGLGGVGLLLRRRRRA